MSNLLKRAKTDIQIARTLMTPEANPTSDEMIMDQAAYHIQQGIEKALKYQTEISGIPYKKIHNLVGLITDVEKTGFQVSTGLKEMAFQISDWEASSRYNDDFSVLKTDLEKAIQLYEELETQILKNLESQLGKGQESIETSKRIGIAKGKLPEMPSVEEFNSSDLSEIFETNDDME